MEKKLVLQVAFNRVIYNIYLRCTSDLYKFHVVKNSAPDVYTDFFDMNFFRGRYDKTTALVRVVDEIFRSE